MAQQAYKEARTPQSKGKKLDHISVKESENGGHTVEHHYADDGMVYHKSKTYTFGKDEGSDLMDHVAKHMHVTASEAKGEEDGEAD